MRAFCFCRYAEFIGRITPAEGQCSGILIQGAELKRAIRAILVSSALLLVPVALRAQESNKPPNDVSAGSVSTPIKISKNDLTAHGFSFDERERPMCKINGPEGTCRVEAFIFAEKRVDEASFSCSKLDRASYVGHCVKGKLDGFAIVIADGSTKLTREAFISYFHEGRMAYPTLTSDLVGDLDFGVREKMSSYGCVYFGKWDKSAQRCARFSEIYGSDIFTESNAQKLRDGTFDLSNYGRKFAEFIHRK